MAYKDIKTKAWTASINYTKLDGTYARKRKYGFKTKKEAESWERDNFIYDDVTTNNPPMSQVLDEFIQSKQNVVKESTLVKNNTVIRLHIRPYFANKKLMNINHQTIIKWRNELLNKGLSNNRVNHCVKSFKEIYVFASNIYNIDNKPFSQVKKLRVNEKKDILFYTLEEYNLFSSKIDDPIYKALFQVFYFCGLRKGEALALCWDDIDFEMNEITVNKSVNQKLKGIPFEIGETKNKSSNRTVKLDNKTTDMLSQLKSYYKQNYKAFNDKRFVFGFNKPIPETTLSLRYENYRKLAGTKKIRIHDFRHSHASLLINNGANAVLVAKRLGHSNIEMTLNTYSHLFEEEEDRIIKLINNL